MTKNGPLEYQTFKHGSGMQPSNQWLYLAKVALPKIKGIILSFSTFHNREITKFFQNILYFRRTKTVSIESND